MTRDEALALGMKRYTTCAPCRKGHGAERYVIDRKCVECAREKCLRKSRADREAHAGKARRYYAANREAIAPKRRDYLDKNPHIPAAQKALRKARKLNAMPAWYGEFDAFVMLEAADVAARRKRTTGVAWHVDHMIPLQCRTACGLHCASNIQVIPARPNIAKGNRMLLTEPLE